MSSDAVISSVLKFSFSELSPKMMVNFSGRDWMYGCVRTHMKDALDDVIKVLLMLAVGNRGASSPK